MANMIWFTPAIQSPHIVFLTVDDQVWSQRRKEIEQWFHDNPQIGEGERYGFYVSEVHTTPMLTVRFVFESETTALLFKLRWG